jgi:hypothetical protein
VVGGVALTAGGEDILLAVTSIPDCFYLWAGGILRPGGGGWRPAACVSSILADQLGLAAITGWALDLLRTALNVLKGNTIYMRCSHAGVDEVE